MKKSILLSFLLFSFLSYSQIVCYSCVDSYKPVNNPATPDYNAYFAASNAVNFAVTSKNQSIISEFQTATISIGDKSKLFLARVNGITNEIEIKSEDDIIYNLQKFDGVKVSFNTTKEQYKSAVYKDKVGQELVDYFLIPNTSNNLLLKQTRYTFVQAKASKTGYDKAKPAYYKEQSEYYFVDQNQSLVVLTTNKKVMKAMYGKQYSKIASYVKKNRIKDNKESDLSKLALYMTVLQKDNNLNTKLASTNK